MATTSHPDGLRKAAILLVQLGKDNAAMVVAKPPRPMVKEITAEVVRLRDVSWEDAESVVGEAYTLLVSDEVAGRGGLELAKQMLAQSVGSDRAEEIMERLRGPRRPAPVTARRPPAPG